MKNESYSLEIGKLQAQEQYYRQKFEELVHSASENKDFFSDLTLKQRFLRRGHFCRFCYILLKKYPELRGDFIAIYRQIEPKGDYGKHYNYKLSTLTKDEIQQLKEAVKVEEFIEKIESIKKVKITGKVKGKEGDSKVSLAIEHDSMLLDYLKDFLWNFWYNWRGDSKQAIKDNFSQTGKPKNYYIIRRNEFANRCYDIVANNNKLSSKRQKSVFVYCLLYIFNYIPQDEHEARKEELYPDNSYGTFIESILGL